MGGRAGGGASSQIKKAARRIFVQTCGSFCHRQQTHVLDNSTGTTATGSSDSPSNSSSAYPKKNFSCNKVSSEIGQSDLSADPSSNKNLCPICLDPLNYSSGSSPGQAIFTAQCSHAFHFACILSNVNHGSVTCPICRAHWTQLPRNLNTRCSLHYNKTDPILRILDDSIANFRVHRRSFLRSARYDDDDPIEPDHTTDQPRLYLSLVPSQDHLSSSSPMAESPRAVQHFSPTGGNSFLCSTNNRAYLSVKLAHQPATDLVLVASPNGPHLRLMKQSMALVVSSLRPMDRLAIVTYSSAAARIFPLRRMTSYGKRTALQVIDRLFYMGQADPMEGLKKGVKILGDRVHKNPESCILHLSDNPSRSYHRFDMEVSVKIHRFHVGYGYGTSNGFIMNAFEEFLARTLGGAIRDIQLRIGEGARIISIGELRGGEERKIPLYLGESRHVRLEFSYVDSEDEHMRTGETVIGIIDEGDRNDGADAIPICGRTSSVESWDYHDPFLARRWAKHLHGYRL
ncbi:Anaphase-promoting complex (APC), subunit 11 [Olea europaea subsp. europaea]|uniref:Anaphase-promoting complex (APC), subunit 11 n=1 Tax=Olea europaea subsp. europaea TaxID=158383 RepID=A0A8S0VCA6_OLEEU|nr:Anaphase-promoting complex (APC), subunit 11 [Olea europaea subsp. europaea]